MTVHEKERWKNISASAHQTSGVDLMFITQPSCYLQANWDTVAGLCCKNIAQYVYLKRATGEKCQASGTLKCFRSFITTCRAKKRGHVFLSYLQRCWIQPTITALISKVGGNVLGGNSCRQIIKDSVSD